MNSKLLGGILLIVGTTIGAGMLALPIATAQIGFWGSLALLVSCWVVMTACAFLFLEVNLWLPPNTNLISMAGATLGKPGQAIAWMTYLLLLYSVVSAYIAGGGDLLHYLLSLRGVTISPPAAAVLFTVLFGLIVYCGIRSVDYVNRGLMIGKLGALVLLVVLITPFVSETNLAAGEVKNITSMTSLSVTIVAFACLLIIPSLRTYFNNDVSSLRKAIFIGTFIPLICYIAWDMVIMGVLPLDGTLGLKSMLHSSTSNSDLVSAVSSHMQNKTVSVLVKFFTSICVATSFLSVSLCLSDFLSDGFRIHKQGKGSLIVYAATFLPPVGVVVFYPDAFIRALSYAGLACFILMVLMPPLMVWSGRYHRKIAKQSYRVPGGKFLLALLLLFGALMVSFGIDSVI
ncbi:MAG: amino acid permease [Gammaproteobacteria bacterium]|nr:MAG: amino acid permease [Gammaproteobacteria bacterium]